MTTEEYLRLSSLPNQTEEDTKKIREYNMDLIKEYPFLLPRKWNDEPIDDYDYQFTEMDQMPKGWRIAFGDEMLKELKDCLEKDGTINEFRIEQIKEKFATLRFYCNIGTDEVCRIIDKYEKLSARICINCGKPAEYISTGWICPYCRNCAEENVKRTNKFKANKNGDDCKVEDTHIKIDEFYK